MYSSYADNNQMWFTSPVTLPETQLFAHPVNFRMVCHFMYISKGKFLLVTNKHNNETNLSCANVSNNQSLSLFVYQKPLVITKFAETMIMKPKLIQFRNLCKRRKRVVSHRRWLICNVDELDNRRSKLY